MKIICFFAITFFSTLEMTAQNIDTVPDWYFQKILDGSDNTIGSKRINRELLHDWDYSKNFFKRTIEAKSTVSYLLFRAIGQTKREEAIPLLLPYIKQDSPDLTAIDALANIGTKECSKILGELLISLKRKKTGSVVAYTIKGLKKMAYLDSCKYLEEFNNQGDSSNEYLRDLIEDTIEAIKKYNESDSSRRAILEEELRTYPKSNYDWAALKIRETKDSFFIPTLMEILEQSIEANDDIGIRIINSTRKEIGDLSLTQKELQEINKRNGEDENRTEQISTKAELIKGIKNLPLQAGQPEVIKSINDF